MTTVVIAAFAISTVIDDLVGSSIQGDADIFHPGEKIPASPFFVTACQEYVCPCSWLWKFLSSRWAVGFSIDTGF